MSSTQGSTLSASQPPKVLANTNTIGTTTRPLKPPSHSGSPRVLPPRIKSMSPVPVTPPRPPPSPSRKIPSSPASVTSTSNTTITTAPGNGDNNSFAQSSAEALEWRKHGKRVRAMLLLEDEEKGGSTFQLTNTCSIQRYYRVAERVSVPGCRHGTARPLARPFGWNMISFPTNRDIALYHVHHTHIVPMTCPPTHPHTA